VLGQTCSFDPENAGIRSQKGCFFYRNSLSTTATAWSHPNGGILSRPAGRKFALLALKQTDRWNCHTCRQTFFFDRWVVIFQTGRTATAMDRSTSSMPWVVSGILGVLPESPGEETMVEVTAEIMTFLEGLRMYRMRSLLCDSWIWLTRRHRRMSRQSSPCPRTPPNRLTLQSPSHTSTH
jgi:hypothetical protein